MTVSHRLRRTLLCLLFAANGVAQTPAPPVQPAAQAPDDCSLTFNGTARKAVKLRPRSLAATYTTFGTAAAPRDLTAWFAAACMWQAKVPATIPETAPIVGAEDQVATLQAYLVAVKYEGDGDRDFHIELSASSDWTASNHVIVEVPPGQEYCDARHMIWSFVQADAGGTPPKNPYIFQHPVLVNITGYVFYDAAHAVPNGCVDNGGRGIRKDGGTSMVQGIWELHPVISVAPVSTTPGAPGSTTQTTGTPGTSGTTGASTAGAPPPPPTNQMPPGVVWYVRIQAPFDGQKIHVTRDLLTDPSAKPVALLVADDVRLAPAFPRLQAGRIAYLRVNKDLVTRVEQLTTDDDRRMWTMIIIGAVLFVALVAGRGLLRGKDGPYSKSKFQLAVWFSVLILAYVSTNLLRSHEAGTSLLGWVNIPAHLALLSGISLFTFGAAKG